MLHRDLLLSALDRPSVHAHYRGAGIVEQAGVLAAGLVASHAWIDGNKRTTWVATRLFLDLNGVAWQQEPSRQIVIQTMVQLTTRAITAETFSRWLRAYLR